MQQESTLIKVLYMCAFLALAACSSGSDNPVPSISSNDRFLEDNSARANVVVTQSGLQYEVLRASNGPMPNADSTVTVHYAGELVDGTAFDSSYVRGEPSTFDLSGTIPGWVEGLQLMNVGSQFRFVMPPSLAYADAGAGAEIPPDSILIFEVELLEINSI